MGFFFWAHTCTNFIERSSTTSKGTRSIHLGKTVIFRAGEGALRRIKVASARGHGVGDLQIINLSRDI